jgi:uncharacterized membrane protein YbhN (UPF0104 family)
MSLVIGVTPGGLGFLEAALAGLLLLAGIPSDDLAILVISQRVAQTLCYAALLAISYSVVLAWRKRA